MSDEAKAEKAAREKLLAAIKLMRSAQSILQFAGWQHDPFYALMDEARNTYEQLQGYTVEPINA